MSKTTTQTGVVQGTSSAVQIELPPLTEADAEAAFLDRWTEKDSPKETSEEKPNVTNESDPSEEEEDDESNAETTESDEDEADPDDEAEEEADDEGTEEESEEGAEDEEESKGKKTLDDDATVEVKVDNEVKQVSVKELKRLWGQEAALTRKSQEVAAKRKDVEFTEQKLAVSLEKLYQKAAERWEPYSKIDMLVASKQLDADQFTALRQEAQAAYEEFRFISEEADRFVKEASTARQEQLKAAAHESVKVLKEAIPNWNSQLYDSIREYAIGVGMAPEVVNMLVDPVAIQLIHKARLFDESKKIATKKKVSTPKKIVKSTNSTTAKDLKGYTQDRLVQKLRSSGDLDDAAELFLSRWRGE